jgi:hypothetical protein
MRFGAFDPRKLLHWSLADLPLVLVVLAALFSWASTPELPAPAAPNALLHSVLDQVRTGEAPSLVEGSGARDPCCIPAQRSGASWPGAP